MEENEKTEEIIEEDVTETETTESDTWASESGTPNTPKGSLFSKEEKENDDLEREDLARENEMSLERQQAKEVKLVEKIKTAVKKDKEDRCFTQAVNGLAIAFFPHLFDTSRDDGGDHLQEHARMQEQTKQKVDPALIRTLDQGRSF